METIRTDVCIVGGGPGGAFLSLLLARSGLRVTLLEKAKSFERQMRGESISPSCVQLLAQHGLLPRIDEHGYLEVVAFEVYEDERRIFRADYGQMRRKYRFPIDIPQPALIGAILEEAAQYAGFELRMETMCRALIEEEGDVRGVVATGRGGERLEVHCPLVVGADGRYSVVRRLARLATEIQPLERDFFWLKLPRPADWGAASRLKIRGERHVMVLPTFPDYLRIGINVPKGAYKEMQAQGIARLRAAVAELEPSLEDALDQHIQSFTDATFLDIFMSRTPEWSRDGLVLIGDAAHTMSPVLGQGVNLAMQDAVELAPAVSTFVKANPRRTVRREALVLFERQRKRHVDFVRRFQDAQERALTRRGAFAGLRRRARMRVLDLLPWKRWMLERLMYFGLPADPAPAVRAAA